MSPNTAICRKTLSSLLAGRARPIDDAGAGASWHAACPGIRDMIQSVNVARCTTLLSRSLGLMAASLLLCAVGSAEDGALAPQSAIPTQPHQAALRVEGRRDASGRNALHSVSATGESVPLTLLGATASPYIAGRPQDVADLDPTRCQPSRLWKSPDEFLDAVAASGLNTVRSFVHNPWLPGEPEPFVAGRPLEEPEMSPELLRRLSAFGVACDRRGIALQMAIFDHISVRHDAFGQVQSPLRPWLLGEAEELGNALDPKGLCAAFFRYSRPDGTLTNVGVMERLWIRSVVRSLPQPSVIYEVVNEARWRNNPYLVREDLLRWQDWAIAQIREAECDFDLPRHTIAVSPDPHGPREGAGIVLEDLRAWRQLEADQQLSHFSEVDLVVLHGQPFFGRTLDPRKVRNLLFRSTLPFIREFPQLTWELSTDGLNGPQHWSRDPACVGPQRQLSQLRHGFFAGTLLGGPPEHAPPFDWARAALELGQKWGPGRVHFNNWSPAAPALRALSRAQSSVANRR